MANELKPMITKTGTISCQVCVPKEFSDKEVIEIAENLNPCGTEHGWRIRREGDRLLLGDPERNPCKSREGFVHIMLDA